MERRLLGHAGLALALILALAACGPGRVPEDGGTPSPSPSGAPPSPSPSGAPPPSPSPSGVPPPTTPSGPDRKGDLVHGYLTLDGTVGRTPECVSLAVGTDRWVLLRAPADLRDGAEVRVRGRRAAAPEGCAGMPAIVVSSVVAR